MPLASRAAFLEQLSGLFYPKTDSPLSDAQLRALGRREPPPESFPLPLLHELARQWRGETARSIVPLAEQGTFHRLFRLSWGDETAILRVQLPQTPDEPPDPRLPLEEQLTRRLRQAGIPAAPILHTDISRRHAPWDWQMLAPAAGRPLTELEGDESTLLQLLERLGAMMARLHRALPVTGAGWPDPWSWSDAPADAPREARPLRGLFPQWTDYLTRCLDDHLRRLTDDQLLTPEEARTIASHFATFASSPVAPGLLHGDPGSHNAFHQAGEISALLDWDDALIGDPWYDVAFWATFHPERRYGAFLRGYLGGRAWSPEEARRFRLYHLRITLAKIVHRQRFSYADLPGRPTGRQRILESAQRVFST
ncbi:MAG: aminoglycoside phosphotransferase family protein [Magnetococcales bacterium]|nr:aminoglycoside phosphotransferase family protein [Magnetococcales bacterium]